MRSTGVRLVLLGLFTQILGFGVDAWMHARDVDLAAREDVFSFANPGHALVLAGLVVAAMGAAAVVVGRTTAVVAVGLALSMGAAGASVVTAGDHEHVAAAASASASAAVGDHHAAPHSASGHGSGESLPALSADEAASLDAQLASARAAAARYPTVAAATAAGFVRGTPYERLVGAHYFAYDEIDAAFDPARPEMLLFDGDAPEARLVGLTYYVVAPHAPDGFTGRADQWHQHDQVCMTPDGPVFAGDGYRRCPASGRLSWMLHAWVVPGMESPQGVFSAENVRIR